MTFTQKNGYKIMYFLLSENYKSDEDHRPRSRSPRRSVSPPRSKSPQGMPPFAGVPPYPFPLPPHQDELKSSIPTSQMHQVHFF